MKLTAKNSLFLCLITVSCIAQSYAQKNLAVLDFEDNFCIYKGYYDPGKYTKEELLDTYALTSWMVYFDGEDLENLEKNYQEAKRKLRALRLVRVRLFADERDSMLRYIDESYRIQRLRLQAEEDPTVLFSILQENEKVKYYAEALNRGEESLLEAYKSMIKESMKQNAYPEALWRRYLANVRSEDRYELAFEQVLTYGWWNEVNRSIYHYPHDGSIGEHFFKLFERVTMDCDEP